MTLASATLLAGPALAAPLSFDDALRLAQSAPSLAARDADVAAARSTSIAAGRLPDPKLSVGLGNFPISGPPAGTLSGDSMTMATVGVSQEVPNGAKRAAARARAEADIDIARSGQALEARNVRLSTALAWIDLHYAKRRLAALDEVDRAIGPLRTSAPSQLAAGAARPGETLEADELAATLADRRASLVAALAKARAELVRWTGDPNAETAGDPPAYPIDPFALRAGLGALPALRAYDAMDAQAQADVALARADKRPDWSWDLTYQRRDPMYGDMVSIGASVGLPLFGKTRQDPIIAARTAAASRVGYEREAARRALAAALDADLADHAMHHERLMRARSTLEPLAARRADLETASYAAGTASLSDVLSAFLALAETKIDIIDRDADVQRDAVRIVLTYGSQTQ
ncbi:TolC family protein [Phenylobacterium sp. 58.2.17]|uniref:TolC family protein n=1 Tax=Phenylobacterium sp. 58.2.17 TaxID=2969306 RepID=UPI00226547EA|nr:TolC family protein [Phenylobacterium sp. 58.2.17]MCX7587797.1 TolC family protein [Phenylobacterium sp. 58.2.17]